MLKTLMAGDSPRDALREIQQRAGLIRANAEFLRDEAVKSGLPTGVILGKASSDLREHRDRVAALAQTPGLNDLSADVGFDVEAGVQEVVAAADRVLDWVATGLPTDPDGWLLTQRFEGGQMVSRQLTPAECEGLIEALDALIAVIE